MLGHYKMSEPDAEGRMSVTDEWVEDPCEDCGAESIMNICSGDGRLHHHGRVHIMGGGLAALCEPCAVVQGTKWGVRPWDK